MFAISKLNKVLVCEMHLSSVLPQVYRNTEGKLQAAAVVSELGHCVDCIIVCGYRIKMKFF